MNPIYVGLFRDSIEAISHANSIGTTGLYLADFHESKASNEVAKFYFWLNNSIPYFGIYFFPHKKSYKSMVALNAACIGSGSTHNNISYEKGQLLYTDLENFCNYTINISHPATDWLLFNQDLWSSTNDFLES